MLGDSAAPLNPLHSVKEWVLGFGEEKIVRIKLPKKKKKTRTYMQDVVGFVVLVILLRKPPKKHWENKPMGEAAHASNKLNGFSKS